MCNCRNESYNGKCRVITWSGGRGSLLFLNYLTLSPVISDCAQRFYEAQIARQTISNKHPSANQLAIVCHSIFIYCIRITLCQPITDCPSCAFRFWKVPWIMARELFIMWSFKDKRMTNDQWLAGRPPGNHWSSAMWFTHLKTRWIMGFTLG